MVALAVVCIEVGYCQNTPTPFKTRAEAIAAQRAAAGERASAKARASRQKTAKPQANLYPPALIGPAFFSGSNAPTISWRAVEGAAGYRIEIIRDDSGEKVASEEVQGIEWKPSQFLASGSYHVSVVALNAQGESGIASTPRAFFAGFGNSKGMIDDGDAAATASPGWIVAANAKSQGGSQSLARSGVGDKTVTWTFDADPGRYHVDVTWVPIAGAATNARFTVSDGDKISRSEVVDQSQPTSGIDGWHRLGLGDVIAISGKIVIQLTNDAAGTVIADAVRIAPVGQIHPAAGLKPSFNDRPLLAGIVNFGGVARSSEPVLRELQVENTNQQSITVDKATATGGFVVRSGPAKGTSLAPGQVVTYCIEMPTHSSGYFKGNFTLTLSDGSSIGPIDSSQQLNVPLMGGVGP